MRCHYDRQRERNRGAARDISLCCDTIQQEEFRKGASSERIAHRSSQHELRGLFLLSSFEGRATSLSTPRDLDPTFEGHLTDYCKYLQGITC